MTLLVEERLPATGPQIWKEKMILFHKDSGTGLWEVRFWTTSSSQICLKIFHQFYLPPLEMSHFSKHCIYCRSASSLQREAEISEGAFTQQARFIIPDFCFYFFNSTSFLKYCPHQVILHYRTSMVLQRLGSGTGDAIENEKENSDISKIYHPFSPFTFPEEMSREGGSIWRVIFHCYDQKSFHRSISQYVSYSRAAPPWENIIRENTPKKRRVKQCSQCFLRKLSSSQAPICFANPVQVVSFA